MGAGGGSARPPGGQAHFSIWCPGTLPLKLPHLRLCLSRVSGSQPHPDVKPMAYASTLLHLGMM